MNDAVAPHALAIAVETPQHAGLAGCLDYRSEQPLAPGTLVRVPLGKRDVPGIVWRAAGDAAAGVALRDVREALEALPPLSAAWRHLVAFAAGYYQRGLGELALAVLPPELRRLDAAALARRLARLKPPVALAAAGAGAAAAVARPGGRGCGAHRRAAGHPSAARRHRQRQDRGLPACRGAGARRGPSGAGAGARDQSHAATRSALCRALCRPPARFSAQRPDAATAFAPLAGRAPRPGRPGAGHAAGGVCVDAAPRADRGR